MEKPSTARIALKWGLILGIAASIIVTIIYLIGIWKSVGVAVGLMLVPFIIPPFPYIIIHVLANNEYKRLNDNYLSFGEGVTIGVFIAVISSMISLSFQQIYVLYIDSTLPQQIIEALREFMENMGVPDEQIEKQLADTSKYEAKSGLSFIGSLLFYTFLGFILSLGITAATKKSKPEIDFN